MEAFNEQSSAKTAQLEANREALRLKAEAADKLLKEGAKKSSETAHLSREERKALKREKKLARVQKH